MKCSVFLLLPFKKNHAYAENVIVAYEEQPKVDFCKGIGIPLEIASSLTIMPLWHHGPRAFIIILFSAEGYNQPNYDIFSVSRPSSEVLDYARLILKARQGR